MISTILPAKQNHTKKKVMLVDDMPQVRRDLRQLLEITGLFEIVAETGDGQEAIHRVHDLSVDAVILDLEMAGLDGYELTRLIKLQDPSIRVIIMSAYGGQEEIEHAQAVGADSFIVKGVHYSILVKAILGEDPSTNMDNPIKGG
jgi:two-component system, NarL family, nitrate/nitrite response regulator NarP